LFEDRLAVGKRAVDNSLAFRSWFACLNFSTGLELTELHATLRISLSFAGIKYICAIIGPYYLFTVIDDWPGGMVN
jgi:hypothetical protein